MKRTAAPIVRSDVSDGLGEVPAMPVEVLRVVLALAVRMILRLGQDDRVVLPRACAVRIDILDPHLNVLRVVRGRRAFGDGEATVACLHLDAVICDPEADGEAERL